MNNTLVVDGIHYRYGNKEVLSDVQFTCQDGIVALLGNNGAGKSTLMNILVGLKTAQRGTAQLNGINLFDRESYPLQKVGYLPQDFEIYGNVSGYDFLSYVYDLKNLHKSNKKAEIEKLVSQFDLHSVIKKNFRTYSGGYKRRLGIAQAVLGNPELIIVDEPSVGLDPEQRMQFRSFLADISKNAITIISTHIIEDIELYSDTILVLKDRTIQFQGTVKKALDIARTHLMEMELTRSQLTTFKRQATVIEEKRIDHDLVKVKFIQNKTITENCHPVQEVSLENAYVCFQKI